MMMKTRRVVGANGETTEVLRTTSGRQGRAGSGAWPSTSTSPQWAMEDPGRWGPWAAPCPIRPEDLARQKEIRSRKSRMDQRTRERLPLLAMLLTRVNAERLATAACLQAAEATEPGAHSRSGTGPCIGPRGMAAAWRGCGSTTPKSPKRRDATGEEDRAFWTWAAVETLRHTGIRIEELTELSHHSLIQYTVPDTGETVPLLQIAPSKTDTERLLVISPELADVLATTIGRIRDHDGAVTCVASYDFHERVWNAPMPLLFQRRFGIEHRAIPADTIREWIGGALEGAGIKDASGRPLRFTPHDFRRMFITDVDHAWHAPAHRPARGRSSGYQHDHGIQGRLSRRGDQRAPGLHRPPASVAPQRRVPRAHRTGVGRIPRPLRTAQSRTRHLRSLLCHAVHPRTRLRPLPAAAA